MSATTAHPLPGRSAPAWGAGRVLALIGGSLLALIALGLAMAGVLLVLAHGTARDSAGFYTSDTERFSTPTYALTSEGMQIGDIHGDGADWALDAIDATVRVRASQPAGARSSSASPPSRRSIATSPRSRTRRSATSTAAPSPMTRCVAAAAPRPAVPANASFWAATATGPGTQALTWKPDVGRWAVVVMNADGSRRVAADVSVGAKTGVLLPIGIGLFALSLLVVIGAAALIALALREPSGPAGGATAAAAAPVAAVHCATLAARARRAVAASVRRDRRRRAASTHDPRTMRRVASSSSAEATRSPAEARSARPPAAVSQRRPGRHDDGGPGARSRAAGLLDRRPGVGPSRRRRTGCGPAAAAPWAS